MLTLTFKEGEVVAIGCEIAIKVGVRIGNRRKLIVNAPETVTVRRGELDDLEERTPGKDFGNLVLSRIEGEEIEFLAGGQTIGSIRLVKNRSSVRLGFDFYDEIVIRRPDIFRAEYLASGPSAFENPMLSELLREAA